MSDNHAIDYAELAKHIDYQKFADAMCNIPARFSIEASGHIAKHNFGLDQRKIWYEPETKAEADQPIIQEPPIIVPPTPTDADADLAERYTMVMEIGELIDKIACNHIDDEGEWAIRRLRKLVVDFYARAEEHFRKVGPKP